jgi:hypothetical protein
MYAISNSGYNALTFRFRKLSVSFPKSELEIGPARSTEAIIKYPDKMKKNSTANAPLRKKSLSPLTSWPK